MTREPGVLAFDGSNNQINVRVLIQGHGPYWFIIDTGAVVEGCIDRSIVESLDIASTGEAEVGDGSGINNQRMPLVRITSVELGSMQIGPLEFVVGDYTRPLRNGENRVGILGLAAFERLSLTIDYPEGFVVVSSTPVLQGQSDHDVAIPLDGEFEVPLLIGSTEVQAIVDTGSSSPVTFPERMLDVLATEGPLEGPRKAGTKMNTYQVWSAVLKEPLWMAGYRLDAQTVFFNDHHEVAIVGAQVLRQFRITIELSQKRARFERSGSGEVK